MKDLFVGSPFQASKNSLLKLVGFGLLPYAKIRSTSEATETVYSEFKNMQYINECAIHGSHLLSLYVVKADVKHFHAVSTPFKEN